MLSFSFIIPVKPGGAVTALDSLGCIEPGGPLFEILIAEGSNPSRQRNLAAHQSQGDVLFFLDDDSLVKPDCLTQCAAALEHKDVAVVGGPSLTPDSDTFRQRLFGLALSSVFGAGAMLNRYRSVGQARVTTEKELILCNLAIRREQFLSAGGFDERLYPNEENELLDRIGLSGFKMMHLPDMGVRRSQRPTLNAFMRQMFNYGRGRAQQTLLAGPGNLTSFLPMFFVLYLLLLPLIPAAFIWKLPLIAYASLAIIFAGKSVVFTGNPGSFLVLALFPIMHCCNGIGLLYGFLRGRPEPPKAATIVVRQVKSLDQTTWPSAPEG